MDTIRILARFDGMCGWNGITGAFRKAATAGNWTIRLENPTLDMPYTASLRCEAEDGPDCTGVWKSRREQVWLYQARKMVGRMMVSVTLEPIPHDDSMSPDSAKDVVELVVCALGPLGYPESAWKRSELEEAVMPLTFGFLRAVRERDPRETEVGRRTDG